MIFETQRLQIRGLNKSDADGFCDLMGNPNVMNPIPQKPLNKKESDEKLDELLSSEQKNQEKKVWAILEKNKSEFIGLCALIKNDENKDEIVYRLREQYWGKGFGTEIANGLVQFCFTELNLEEITANVNIENTKSVKILQKLMTPIRAFFNEKDNCTNQRYQLKKENWLRQYR